MAIDERKTAKDYLHTKVKKTVLSEVSLDMLRVFLELQEWKETRQIF